MQNCLHHIWIWQRCVWLIHLLWMTNKRIKHTQRIQAAISACVCVCRVVYLSYVKLIESKRKSFCIFIPCKNIRVDGWICFLWKIDYLFVWHFKSIIYFWNLDLWNYKQCNYKIWFTCTSNANAHNCISVMPALYLQLEI